MTSLIKHKKASFFPGLPVILIVCCVAYLNVFHSEFLNWDDNIYVSDNPLIASFNLSHIKPLFTQTYDGHYHPLTLLSLMMDKAIAGNNPVFFHTINLILHLFNILLVYVISVKILKNNHAALLTTVIFALHPLNVEVVAWISARKDLLSGFFYLTSLVLYLKYIDNKKLYIFLMFLLCFIFSLLSKEQTVSLAPTIVLIDLFYKRKWNFRLIAEKIPVFLIAALAGLAAIYAQKTTGYIEPMEGSGISLLNRIILGTYGIVMYVYKIFIPLNLSAYYPYPFPADGQIPSVYFIYPLIIAALIALIIIFRKQRLLWFGSLFFLINIFLMLRLLHANTGDFIIADRYVYVAGLGIYMIVACYLVKIIKGFSYRKNLIIVTVVILLTASLAGAVFLRSSIWNNSLSLLNDILAKNPNVYTALNCRADLLTEDGQLNAALSDLNQAIKLNKHNDRAYLNRGRVYFFLGETQLALTDLNMAIKLDPQNEKSFYNRGLLHEKTGNLNDALYDYSQSLRLQPDFYDAYVARAGVKCLLGDVPGAYNDIDKAIKMNPANGKAWSKRGYIKLNTGNFPDAVSDFQTALDKGHNDYQTLFFSGLAHYNLHQFKKAFDAFNMALEIADDPDAILYRGFSSYNLNRFNECIADMNAYLKLMPGNNLAYAMRGMAYIRIGDKLSGCSDLRMAANFGNEAAKKQSEQFCK